MIKQNWILKKTYENIQCQVKTFYEIKYLDQCITIYLEDVDGKII